MTDSHRDRPTCTGPECGLPVRCKGLCNAHYRQHIVGQRLRPLSPQGRKYQPGEKLYHGERPCTFAAAASPEFLMVAAILREHPEPEWAAGVADRCTQDATRSVTFIVYDDDKSVGMVSRQSLSRHPRFSKGTHWYSIRKAAESADGGR